MRSGPILRGVRAVLALLALAMPLAARDAAAQQADLEAAVKATFLYRFGSFVDWPPSAFAAPDAPLVVCVSGDAAFAGVVQRASAGERIANRPVLVRAIGVVASSPGCHIIYVTGASGQNIASALTAVRGETVLTVTDAQHGATRGAIHFVVVDDRVRFHIDRGAAERNHLNLSSRLLSIALSVRRRGGGAS
ncbi:MAG: YfiR family protein [Phycisphaerales bacterium]|nr:YfiR family protein [Hyphomonadaceae bacterium]